jgi:NAD-specific glutamate dehydrogenase
MKQASWGRNTMERKNSLEQTRDIEMISRQKEKCARSMIMGIRTLFDSEPQVSGRPALDNLTEILCQKLPLDILNNHDEEVLGTFIKQRYTFIEGSAKKPIAVSITPYPPISNQTSQPSVVLECLLENRPFIIDSLIEHLHHNEMNLSLTMYSVLKVEYDGQNQLVSLNKGTDATSPNQTYCCFIINNIDSHTQSVLEKGILGVLETVCCVVDDFGKMSRAIDNCASKGGERATDSLMDCERRQLLDWFSNGRVIFLGAGEIRGSDVSPEISWEKIQHPMGYLRRKKDLKDKSILTEIGKLAEDFLESDLQFNLIESSNISEVHRRDKIRLFFNRSEHSAGYTSIGFYLILFTRRSLKEDALSIPVTRLKVNSIIERMIESGKIEGIGGFSYKSALDFFGNIPTSELFRLNRSELAAMYEQYLHFGDSQQTQLGIYTQPNRRYVRFTFCISAHHIFQDVQDRIEDLLFDRFQIRSKVSYGMQLGRKVITQHIFWFPKDQWPLDEIDLEDLEKQVTRLSTYNWSDLKKTSSPNTVLAQRA